MITLTKTDDEDYEAFMEAFLAEDGFLPGYYVVNGVTQLIGYDDEQDREVIVKLSAKVDFKVK